MKALASSEVFLFEDFASTGARRPVPARSQRHLRSGGDRSRGLGILGVLIERAGVQPIGLTRRLSPPGSNGSIVGVRYLENENICQAEGRSGVNRAG